MPKYPTEDMVTENAEAEAAQMATTAAVNFMVEVEVEVKKLLIEIKAWNCKLWDKLCRALI